MTAHTEMPVQGEVELLPKLGDTRATPTWHEAPVVGNRRIADRYWALSLHAPTIAADVQPGQFVMLTVARRHQTTPVLPRPMAVYDVNLADGLLHILYGVVGAGTTQLTSFSPGEEMLCVGPLGRAFDLVPDTRYLVLLGRGIGICSLTLLAKQAKLIGVPVTAISSSRSPDSAIGSDLYRAHGVHVREVYDSDGSSHVQRLYDDLERTMPQEQSTLIAVCGSRRLLQMAGNLARSRGAQIQVSLEAHMACGLGYCHGCATGERSATDESPLICQDGPAFSYVVQETTTSSRFQASVSPSRSSPQSRSATR